MSYPLFEVLSPGLLTTVQDLGRPGFQQYGLSFSGAMDPLAVQIANLLVGNPRHEAVLEITWKGPRLRLLHDALLAIGGADLTATLNSHPISPWQSFPAHKGDVLSFGPVKKGVRAYLAVSGGLDVPPVMNSKATYLLGKIGGLQGRPLTKGDVLYGSQPIKRKGVRRRLAPEHIPNYSNQPVIRVIWGPEKDFFPASSLHQFLTQPYRVSPEANRMGYRLIGPSITHHEGQTGIISSAVTRGTIQVPPDGQPIILMADSQTTGGYPRLAVVTTVDLPAVAQLGPGDFLSFQAIEIAEAHRLYKAQEQFLRQLSIASKLA